MKIEEYNHVYDQIQRTNAAIYGDRNYDEKPGVTNVPIIIAEVLETRLGDDIEKVQYPALLVEPTDIMIKYGKLLDYVRERMDPDDKFDRLVRNMVESAAAIFSYEHAGCACEEEEE